jgi:hypothetical protein
MAKSTMVEGCGLRIQLLGGFAALGEQAFSAAWEAGQKLDDNQAMQFALAVLKN